MKNIFRFWMAVAIICGAVSCAKEDISSSLAGGEVEVTFTANLPELGTRAYGEAEQVNTLRYYVYDNNGTLLEGLSNTTTGVNIEVSKTTTVNLVLIKGMTYNILFWADSNNGYYSIGNGVVSLTDIDNINANDESRDAFYAAVKGFNPADANADTTIELYRPFAQLNAKVTNMAEVNKSITVTSTTISTKIYTTFNPFAENGNEVVGGLTAEPVTFNATTMTAEDLAAGHLSMNYLLAPAGGCVADIAFTFNNDKEVPISGTTYTNVPLKANYRTNIIGKLLTNSTNFTVEIKPAFGEPDVEEWESITDGVVLMNNTYLITSLNGLKWFADATNGITRAGGNTFKGKTVQLGTDIDLNNELWTPIAANGKFEGKFDGGNYTISNLKVKVDDRAPAGLFARASYVSNLKLENVSIEGHYKAGAVVGDGLCSRINNCHVKNAYIKITPLNEDDGNHAGGIVGYLSAESEAYVTNCSVTDANIIAYRDCGGIAGTTTGGTCSPVVKNNSLKDVYIVANQLDPYCDATKNANMGEVVGRNSKNIDLTDNTCDNVHADVLKKNAEGNIKISNIAGISYFAELVDAGNTFAGETIKLENDIDASASNWNPIGDNRTDAAFSGIFDGQGHTINGAHISGDFCWNGAVYGSKEGWGLFSVLDGATVKNLKVDGAIFGSYTVISGVIAGYANDTIFENIDITNSKVAGYNWYTGGVVGWAQGECTFKDINLDNTVAVGSLWDSHGQNAGGIAGGVSAESKITIEDCNIACVLDVINDVTSNYKWYIYRVSGMIIGNTNTTETKYNEVVTATATNVTCKNVTVTYGDWMNYHYCEEYGGRGWGRVEESDYVGFGIPNEHTHSDGKQHYVCIPFNQLFGGSSNGSGHYPVKGLAEFPGVTVNYPESFYREQGYKVEGNTYSIYTGEGFKTIATTVLADGTKNVTIELANDIDLAGIEWPAVKTAAAFVLDGKGYAIKNLTTSAVEDHGFYSTAMFTSTRKATTIKDLVVENATVTGKGGDNSHGAVLVACNYAALNIEGVTVKGSTVSNCDRSSVIATYLYFTNATVKNCVVEGCTVNSIGTAGALLGMNNSHNFEATGNTVKNTTISSSEGSNKAGILIGTWQDAGTLTQSGNVVENSKAINAGTETNNNIGRHA